MDDDGEQLREELYFVYWDFDQCETGVFEFGVGEGGTGVYISYAQPSDAHGL